VERGEYERMHALEERMWWYRGLRALAEQLLRPALASSPASGAVLDAGCGTGGMLAVLRRAAAPRLVFGLEHDSEAARLAAAKSRTPVVVGSVNGMPMGAGALAAYLSFDVLCHRAVEPLNALREARRCLQADGIVLLNLPAYRWLMSAHDRRVHNVRRFTRAETRSLLQQEGFRVLRASYWNTFLFPLMLAHRVFGRDDAQSDVRDYPRWLDAAFSIVLTFERALIGLGVNLPFGGSVMALAVRNA
jgi:SAM-dependent methyltransferase